MPGEQRLHLRLGRLDTDDLVAGVRETCRRDGAYVADSAFSMTAR
jgi:hypothetical protein